MSTYKKLACLLGLAVFASIGYANPLKALIESGNIILRGTAGAVPVTASVRVPTTAYLAEQERRDAAVYAQSPNKDELTEVATVGGLENQCVPAATFALLGKGYPSYSAYVAALQANGFMRTRGGKASGMALDGLDRLLTAFGHPSSFYPVEGNNHDLLATIADSLDEGRAVLLNVDAIKALELETKRKYDRMSDLKDTVFGSAHLIRVTGLHRSPQGQVDSFTVFDMNLLPLFPQDRQGRTLARHGANHTLSTAEMESLLSSFKLNMAFQKGAFITDRPVNPPLPR